ncbi:recombinase family protein [Glaciimonas immobilis]|uniref:Resolvase/invertase-type recombinase catalytic domain-containing protein n=1 Tax=Glaciimonas immobilis TaxID=728004 RepID=A0A840S1Y5_9BURK|nr:recombinase family protein [Glaciimonas immobilis]MBB5202691.1 hypothetical protein [Glaciimonas immobilis]
MRLIEAYGKLDRLSRSPKDVLTLMEKIELAGAGFLSTTEAIDTTSPAGRVMMQSWVRSLSSSVPVAACWPPVMKVASAVAALSSRECS